jgi:amidohydrolase
VLPNSIKDCAKTGLVVDFVGKCKAKKNKSKVNGIALRADMDGLPIPEGGDLPYKSKTNFAHMCGHDGHMATLLATAQAIQNNLASLPEGKMIRLLFQPAEEGPGGALPMINEGCLDGVDEVYGFHNIPNFEEGDIRVCEGGFFATSTTVHIEIVGQGGHGSAPHKCVKDPITCAAHLI